MEPVNLVRRSPENVTDAELKAWGVAVVAAAHDCASRKLEDYRGEDLFHFARLCALGQQHDLAAEAAAKYLADGNAESAESARALIVRANLAMGNLLHAFRAARELMQKHGYDGTVHALVQETITALASKDAVEGALQLEGERGPALLAALVSGDGLRTHDGSYRFPPAALFRDAAASVFLFRVEKRDQDAEALLAKLRAVRAAWPSAPTDPEGIAIADALRRAESLGGSAPAVTPLAAALPVPEAPTRRAARTRASKPQKPPTLREVSYAEKVTVLALYAPWSPQREKLMTLLSALQQQYSKLGVQVFALSTPAIATGDANAAAEDTLAALREPYDKATPPQPPPLPLVVVSDVQAGALAADDYPLFVVADGQGRLRFLDTLSSFEYSDGGRMHRLVAGIVSQQAKPEPAPKPGKRVKVPAEKLERRH